MPLSKYTCLIVLALGVADGCSRSEVSDRQPVNTMVMIDTNTQETYEQPVVQDFPAINPDTGAATLMPALYCPICEAWRAVPPLEEVQRNRQATTCTKHNSPLVTTGKPVDHPYAPTQLR